MTISCTQRKRRKATEFAGSVRSDDLHVTVPHCHTADADAVEAEKVKLKIQTHVCYIRARPGQVLAAAIASPAGDVRVKLGRTDSIRRYL